ncbi:DEHA2G12276p [Debaryomyces hansenii CBS767]|uniref:DEHA2G12276p n=1 Tax=Debaryomyces hansenii (strain ATCC 36239 / CBS 767 / BCRC 21394 / JCM 1990 / NBRC 0083 / IGC 2968) TaxID=284592 RepID=Q6BIA5_DEBHA|nr:DEHA2G12276p [Debaryomyces hansenii CBS767]CAG90552.2 DEHA2G12276p [Debaryomyces hansenii CBS767]|eukprot:XP_462066.2 DEHA2G12276p [Debaryomyces hansenii CBS767]
MTQDEEPSFKVKVYVYDLSHGLAAVYAPSILGINIDAIYHTSVVVYDKEHYINQGINTSTPGTTKYGTPKEVLDMGKTFVTPDIFEDFLDELRNHEDLKYNSVKYDLFDNNCNHFTDVLLDFLVGKNLEDRILKLPQQVLNSPNGHILRQMIGSYQP